MVVIDWFWKAVEYVGKMSRVGEWELLQRCCMNAELGDTPISDKDRRRARRTRVVYRLVGIALAAVALIIFVDAMKSGTLAPVIWFVLAGFGTSSFVGAFAGRQSRRRDMLYLVVLPLAAASVFSWYESHRLSLSLFVVEIVVVALAWFDSSRRPEVTMRRAGPRQRKRHILFSVESAIDRAKDVTGALLRRVCRKRKDCE